MKNTEKKDEDLVKIVQPLVDWYRENKRDLPWRHNPDAYRVWISEIMLQQTRVEAVKGYYDRFLGSRPVEAVGVCFEGLLLPRLPRGPFDRQVARLVTEAGVLCAEQGPGKEGCE